LTAGLIATAYERFSGIRPVLPLCSLPNTFLGSIKDQIPNSILIGSAVFAQLAAESHYTLQPAAPFYQQHCAQRKSAGI